MIRTALLLAAIVATAVPAVLVVSSTSAAVAESAVRPVRKPLVSQVSTDTLPAYAFDSSIKAQHATEVETDSFSWGSTIVSAFQVGRMNPTYGAQAMGWATSTNGGVSWRSGIIPGLTVGSPSPGSYPTIVNQSVAYSARAAKWIIPTVVYAASGTALHEQALLINTSPNGLTWGAARTALSANVDKAWGVCDNTAASSPHYGRCYVAYSQLDSNYALAFISSDNGGRTWTAPVTMPGSFAGYNTNPTVRPDGTVVVVATDLKNGASGSVLFSTVSHDGGASWSTAATVATIEYHTPAGGIRALDKPSVDVDTAGTVWAAWSDCRFRASCAHDDLVVATSTDGVTWTDPHRVGLDPVTSATDRFIPGFAVERGTSGTTAHLGIVSYTYANGACTSTTCRLDVQYATSYDAGATWSAPFTINATPMPLNWLATGNKGRMVGDYESVSFAHGNAVVVASVAATPVDATTFQQSESAMTLPPGWGAGA